MEWHADTTGRLDRMQCGEGAHEGVWEAVGGPIPAIHKHCPYRCSRISSEDNKRVEPGDIGNAAWTC